MRPTSRIALTVAALLAISAPQSMAHNQSARITCKPEVRPAAQTWDQCVRTIGRHAREHARADQRRRCRAAGGTRIFCGALVTAITLENRPPPWAWNPDLHWIISAESGYNPCAVNPGKHICNYTGDRAYGFGQFLKSTEQAYRCQPRPSPPLAQARCIVRYIHGRYHTPAAAGRFKRRTGWY